MSDIEEQVKKIIVDHLGIEESKVSLDSKFKFWEFISIISFWLVIMFFIEIYNFLSVLNQLSLYAAVESPGSLIKLTL